MKKADFIIKGLTPCKKNMLTIRSGSRRARYRRWIAPNKKYQEWEEGTAKDLWIQSKSHSSALPERLPILDPVWLRVVFYRKKIQRIDLTNLLQSIEDAMVKADIIKDDSQVRAFDGSRIRFGLDHERVEITLYWPFQDEWSILKS